MTFKDPFRYFDPFTLLEILDDEQKVAAVVEAARTSMGMEISDLDLNNIEDFGKRVASLSEYRNRLHEYIKNRMDSCAPSLSALIGEQVALKYLSGRLVVFTVLSGRCSFDLPCWVAH